MKRMAILLYALMVVSVVLLSGCSQQQSTQTINAIDSDSDGYTDDVDDFPLDSNLHEKAPFNEAYPLEWDMILQPGHVQGSLSEPDITSDWKYIICNWHVTDPVLTEDQAEKVMLTVTNPTTKPIIKYYSNDFYNHELKFTINKDNLGEWRFNVDNSMNEFPDTIQVTVTVHIELYKVR